MPSTFPSFEKSMTARSLKLGEGINSAVKALCLGVERAVVLGTPVDTGQARSNWIVSLSAPSPVTRPPYFPGSKLGLTESSNADASIAAADAIIAGRRPGQTVYIQNNLDYIQELNDGKSTQAPALFVQSAVKAGIVSLNGVKILV